VLIDVKGHWREELSPFLPKSNIAKEQAESMVKGRVRFSQLFIISPESDIFFPIKPTPKNPCWVVANIDESRGILLTVIDAVEGRILGYGIPPPSYTGFSLSGPMYENPCREAWYDHYLNVPYGAKYWFDIMGYSTEAVKWPTEEKIKSHIQSIATAMFYELAHGCPWGFASGCNGNFYEITYASEVDDWISNFTKLPFTFLGSCDGMCDVNEGTLSYAFRMGSEKDSATVGYCGMFEENCSTCWVSYSELWQRGLFEYMSQGYTVKEAFDEANAHYSACFENQCMRFAGDPNFAVVPVVSRVPPFPSLTIVDDVNDAGCVYPWNFFDENYLTYEICYDADGNSANDVIIIDHLPFEVDYYASEPNGTYDPNSHTVTWEIGNISAEDSNCIHLTVTVNHFAKPGSSFRNYCEIRNNQYSRNATEKTKVCCRGSDVIYVDVNATGYNNGTSWQDAYTDLQDALIGASNCGSKSTILVAGGIYKPAKYIWQEFVTFELVDGAAVYGGFPPGGGQRSPDIYETTLSGDIENNGIPGPYYVVTGANNAIIDGFTITMGSNGIYCKDCNNLTVTNCVIRDNISDANGGGVHCEDTTNLTIIDCIISGNQSNVNGGGIYNYRSSPEVTNCFFSWNHADYGGGMQNTSSNPNLTKCVFSDNTATYCGGGMDNYQSPSVIVANCIFNNNHAGSYGGGISNYSSSPTVVNCTFSKNAADYGGGIYNEASSSPNVTNCILWSDGAGVDGNEIYNLNDNCDPNFSFCDIEGGWLGLGQGNINDDPLFFDANANNFHMSPAGSPCIDEGTNTPIGGLPQTDIDGEKRVVDGDANGTEIVDMGADEYYWSPADFNDDEIVNFIDYAIFANAWNSNDSNSNWNPKCDIAIPANNLIDFNDLAVFCEDWLWQAGWDQPVGFMMMGQSIGEEGGVLFAPAGTSLQSVSEEQQIEKLEPFEIKQIIDWLEQLWLEEETQRIIDKDIWLKFMESLKEEL
jgi:hypothetical protein